MTRPTIDLKEALRRAYTLGFTASSEGYNGEYPFDCDEEDIERELSPRFEEAFEHILSEMPLAAREVQS